MLSLLYSVLWAPPTSFIASSGLRNTYTSEFSIANACYKRPPTFRTHPSIITPSLWLRQFFNIHTTVNPIEVTGFEDRQNSPQIAVTLIEATMGSRLRITAWLFVLQSFSIILTDTTVCIPSEWTANYSGGICTHWMCTASWHTNVYANAVWRQRQIWTFACCYGFFILTARVI